MGSADFRLIRPVGVTADGAFSRPSPKWVFDQTGTLVQVPAGAFAVTYDPSDPSKAPYALVEGAATNVCRYSDNLMGGDWVTYYGIAAAAALGVAPDGSSACGIYPITGSGGTGGSIYYGGWSASPGDVYTASFFIKAGISTTARAGIGTSGAIFNGQTFDLTSGQSSQGNGWTQTYCGNGWYRITITYTAAFTAQIYLCIGFGTSLSAASPQANLLVWRVQIETGAIATSPIYTNGATVTRAADVIASSAGLVYSNVPITEPSYSGTATYAKDAQVYDPGSRLVYQSLTDANTGKALTDTTAWTPQLATNRWQMFDKAVNSQTSAPNLLVVAIKPGQLVNAVGLLNVTGSSVTVTQTDSYYMQSKSLVRHDVLSWYDFFYEEPIREGDVMFDGIPPYANSTLVITVVNPSDTAAIGCCVLGKSRTIGKTAWDLTGGILSYSSSTTDKFGNVTLVRRDNSKVLNFEVYVPSGFESEVYRLLREYTDVEIMVVGAEDYSMTYSYGYLGQWTVPVTNSGKTAHIEFKGLV